MDQEIDPDPLSWDEEDELEEEDLERFGQVEVKMETLEDEEVHVKLEEEDEIQLGIEEMTEEFDLESPLQIGRNFVDINHALFGVTNRGSFIWRTVPEFTVGGGDLLFKLVCLLLKTLRNNNAGFLHLHKMAIN